MSIRLSLLWWQYRSLFGIPTKAGLFSPEENVKILFIDEALYKSSISEFIIPIKILACFSLATLNLIQSVIFFFKEFPNGHCKVTTVPSAITCTVCSCCVVRTVKFNCCVASSEICSFQWCSIFVPCCDVKQFRR